MAATPFTAFAVTTTEYVPAGVVGEDEVDGVELPQPIAAIKPPKTSRPISNPPKLPAKYLRRVANTPPNSRPGRNKVPASRMPFPFRSHGPSELVCTFVAMVSWVVTAALLPAKLTVDGAKAQVAATGRPLHAKVAAPWKLPVGVNVSANVPEAPLLMVSVVGVAEMAKPETTVASLTPLEVDVKKFPSPE